MRLVRVSFARSACVMSARSVLLHRMVSRYAWGARRRKMAEISFEEAIEIRDLLYSRWVSRFLDLMNHPAVIASWYQIILDDVNENIDREKLNE